MINFPLSKITSFNKLMRGGRLLLGFSCLLIAAGAQGGQAQGIQPLPSPWQSTVVGDAAPSGSASYTNGGFTLSASGADIQDTADAFRFLDQSVTG